MNAITEGWQQSKMVPTEANEQVNASRTYADVLREKRARNDAFAIAGLAAGNAAASTGIAVIVIVPDHMLD